MTNIKKLIEMHEELERLKSEREISDEELAEFEKKMKAERTHSRRTWVAKMVDEGKMPGHLAKLGESLLGKFEENFNGKIHTYNQGRSQATCGEIFREFVESTPAKSVANSTKWQGDNAGAEVDRRAMKLAEEEGIDYAEAVQRVLETDLPLARAYLANRS